MRHSSLTLPAAAAPRAPSTALQSVLWAALAVLAAFGVHQAGKGHDRSPLLRFSPLGPKERFDPQLTRTNAGGMRVQFGVVHAKDEPVVHRGAVKLGEHYLELPQEFDGGGFTDLLVSPDGKRWLAVEAFDTEAMGDLQFVASDDGGLTFVHRGTLPWPTYRASLDAVRFDGENVDVELTLDEEAQLSEDWWSWVDRLRSRVEGDSYDPLLEAGRYRVHSSNGARTFGGLRRL